MRTVPADLSRIAVSARVGQPDGGLQIALEIGEKSCLVFKEPRRGFAGARNRICRIKRERGLDASAGFIPSTDPPQRDRQPKLRYGDVPVRLNRFSIPRHRLI